jgi:hypothetical protein
LQSLEEFYPRLQEQDHDKLEESRENKLKQILDRALENVGFNSIQSVDIWLKYIDFETERNNLILVNLLCWMALEVPLKDGKAVLDKSMGIIQNLFATIVERIESDPESDEIPQKYKEKCGKMIKMITSVD